MTDQSNNPLGVPPTIWIVLAVGLVGVFAANQLPFQDARPVDAIAPTYGHFPSDDQDVEARQWQDPLGAVAVARESYEIKKSLVGAATSHSIARLGTDIQRFSKPGDRVLVLGALVPGAHYADDVETRRRIRYATLAGFFGAGYVPVNNEHIGYVSLAGLYPRNTGANDIGAYEWFNKERDTGSTPQERILLMWLDQDGFRDVPIALFSGLVNRIAAASTSSSTAAQSSAAESPAFSAAILGPADSDGLRAMNAELDQATDDRCGELTSTKSPRDISIYSPRATASDWWIVGNALRMGASSTPQTLLADHFHERCANIALFRTVSSDLMVVQSVFDELKYRGVQDASEIALVAERDTLYARLMSRYFHGCAGMPPINDAYGIIGSDTNSMPLCFTYLRGLDGLAPPAPDISGSAPQSGSVAPGTSTTTANHVPVAREAATGRSQLDYLRRLARSLVTSRDDRNCSEATTDRACGHHIKAIGVVGSDIYDKLLVLQALRRAFPRYIFFTTDLDARLTDPENLPWTRQLIVGSSVGLSLRPDMQRSIPPFRDSYQATTYYSTMLAVDRFVKRELPSKAPVPLLARLAWTLKPHVFEIGRNQAFDLLYQAGADAPCRLNGDCQAIAAERRSPAWSIVSAYSIVSIAVVSLTITVLMAWIAMGTAWIKSLMRRPIVSRSVHVLPKHSSIALIALIAIMSLSVWAWASLVNSVTNGGKRIPTPIFGGANHWAASLVEALTILLVITLVIRGQRKLRENAEAIQREFSFSRDPDQLIEAHAAQLRPLPYRARFREALWFPVERLWAESKNKVFAPELSALEALIALYLHRGRPVARLIRVTIATLIATGALLIVEYALMTLEFNLGTSLVNGFPLIDYHSFDRALGDGISLTNLLAIQFLIFWVADAILLARSFVLALAHNRPDWPELVLKTIATNLDLPIQWAELWLNTRLVALRTGAVAKLVWYPSLVIVAMTLAALTIEYGQFGFASHPIALIISASFIVGAAVWLRQSAELWRGRVNAILEDACLQGLGMTLAKSGAVAQLDRLRLRVIELSEGAFAPYSQQPLVRALLVPALTYATTSGVQFLHIGL